MLCLFEQAGVTLDQKVLDIGFRDLEELQTAASLVGSTGYVLGIDIDPQHVETAHKELGKVPVSNITVKEGSMGLIEHLAFCSKRSG